MLIASHSLIKPRVPALGHLISAIDRHLLKGSNEQIRSTSLPIDQLSVTLQGHLVLGTELLQSGTASIDLSNN
jgi:hypothetical protein